MFRVKHNVPDIYPQESRDFQLLSHLYDLVIQSSRFSIDSMQRISDTMRCNENFLPLIGSKVGFYTKLHLTDKVYRQIVAAYPYIIQYKGSKKAFDLCCNLVERIFNIQLTYTWNTTDQVILLTFQDYEPSNFDIVKELFDHVRPCGVSIQYELKPAVPEEKDIINVLFSKPYQATIEEADATKVGKAKVGKSSIKTSEGN